jgi:Tfp pilus assembly protein PilV
VERFIDMNMNKGQSLFELIIAVAVISVMLVTAVGLSTKVVNNTRLSSNQTLANRYTQQAIEWMRGERDIDYVSLYNNRAANGTGRTWCVAATPPSWPGSSGNCGANTVIAGTVFRREVNLTQSGDNIIVRVTVMWNESAGAKQVSGEVILTNWKSG